MKRHFVLDENIIVLAQKGEDQYGVRDVSCLTLIQAILANCHALVIADPLLGRYGHQIRMLERQRIPLVPRVMALVKSLLVDLRKDTKVIPDHELKVIEGLEQLPGVDAGDAEFVRAAGSVAGSVLVTTDRPLTETVTTRGIDREHGFTIRSPRDALALAGPDTDSNA